MKNQLGWILAAILLPGQVHALGLGKLVVDSTLNEPLEARIELISPTREELDSLAIGLADSDAFERAGVERLFILSNLKFELQESETGGDSIRVYSRDPIREPFLNFLVEINWSKGRLLREYTALLDPPLYDPGIRAPSVSAPAPKSMAEGPAAAPSEAPVAPSGEVAPGVSAYSGGDYGPTQGNDTLWSIAARMRPGDSVSMQQMMLALYRTNPEAFINNNINGLRRGQVLRMPSEQELGALSREQAMAEVQSQHAAWDPGRAAEAVAPAPQVAPAAPAARQPTPAPTTPPEQKAKEAELRLVAPGKGESGAGQGAAAEGKGQSLDLANEQLAVLTQENLDLKDRLTEAETIIEDLKRLIALKDDELAALQGKMAGAAPVPAQAAPTPAETGEEAPAPAAETEAPEAPAAEAEVATQAESPAAPRPAAVTPAAPAEKAPAAAVPEQAAPKGDGGIVDTVVGMLKANLMVIGGAIGAILFVLGVLVVMARRKHAEAIAAEDEAAAAAVQFPDFAGSEDETILPGGGEAAAMPEMAERGAAKKPEPEVEAPAAVSAPVVAAPAPAAEAPQEDPLAEVNVFLAYEHFDQAEEFVREAIKREPDNLDFHSKLLEVFYAANDRLKYEQAARVLHDKVDGAGPHWDMALAMWQEISPNRALFSEPSGDEEPAATPATGVGRIDLTAQEKGPAGDDAGLDFDLGEMTAGGTTGGAGTAGGEDMLDVTAAVGLETADEFIPEPMDATGTGDVLDLTGGQGGDGTLSTTASGGEDLLDVTAHADLEGSGLDADPLDVTVSAPAGTGMEEIPAPAPEAGNALDFDLNLDTPAEAPADAQEADVPADDGNMLEFEPGLDSSGGGMVLDLTAGQEPPAAGGEADADAGLELDIGGGDDLGLSLEVPGSDSDSGELSLDSSGSGDGGLEAGLDFDGGTGAGEIELSLDAGDGDDQTVFVPRTDGSQEQSAEDEIATKLDLAKAYVELGDKESARGILDEIAAAGTPDQRRQAQELLQQVS